jgi:phosphotransferase system, enzyme I, PtsP
MVLSLSSNVSVLSPPRRILARLRDVMAHMGIEGEQDTAQGRLDRIVRLVAGEMNADVCSCYVLRAGEVLELFATVGLREDAVHKTRLRVAEGLIGTIAAHARPLAVSEAPTHPNFVYRPETGEDPFLSLAGVPILRSGRVRGVLAIQHKESRAYSDEEIEILETVAMVVAELIGTGTLVATEELAPGNDPVLLPTRIDAMALASGTAIGHAVLHRPQITIGEMFTDNPAEEMRRLKRALADVRSAIQKLLAGMADGPVKSMSESREILETYRMFAEDKGWTARLREAIRQGLTAEAAVQRVQNDLHARLGASPDSYLRDRLSDLDDLHHRLLQHLSAGAPTAASSHILPDTILVARTMGPAELFDYDTTHLSGLILEDGTPGSHVVIVARALGIPVLGQCPGVLTRIESGDPLIVDGDLGQIHIRPSEDLQDRYERTAHLRAQRQRLYADVRHLPSVTADGVPVQLHLNCGMQIDLEQLRPSGAVGVGLYRTEIPFMAHRSYPTVAEQTVLYRQIFDAADGMPVIFRTLDIGGDKLLPSLPWSEQKNPALGWRAIRIGLDRPAMLRQQLRALLKAAGGRPLRIMFPMIAEVPELVAARRLLDMECARLQDAGMPLPETLQIGVMIEVPSLIWQMKSLLPLVDFVSVGSNDLSQYLFAADRQSLMVGGRYDSLSPPMLSVLSALVRETSDANVPLSLCGEMAGDPLEAMVLIGLGVRRLSMAPPAIGPVKAMLRSLSVQALASYLETIQHLPVHSIRQRVRDFATDHQVVL